MTTATELPVDTTASAMDMAEAMFGTGITIVSATYTGADIASGIYTNGDTAAPDLTPSDTGVILSTGNAKNVTNSTGDVNVSAGTTTINNTAGDAGLMTISGQDTFDAAVFEAEFIPDGSTLTMQIVFASEEYLEWVNSGFNDSVGVWVNGQLATLTVGTGDVTINNINNVSNSNFYIDNPNTLDTYNTEMDGFTVTLTLKAPVNPGQVNTIKIAIADGGDAEFDSNLLIAGNSVQTALIATDDDIVLTSDDPAEFDILANDISTTGSTLTITEINGQPVVVGDTVTLPTGEVITLTPSGFILVDDGTATGTNSFSYTVSDGAGNTDVGFVTVTQTVPCFVAGTLIETPSGPRRIEQFRVGDMVTTLDHGPQPVRWVGLRRLSGQDLDAAPALRPIRIARGALGDGLPLSDLLVSPQHRVLVRSRIARRMFDQDEVLVAAKQLLTLPGVTTVEGARSTVYVHLLFDRHEILLSNGAATESFFTGPEALKSVGPLAQAEILTLFPSLKDRSAARMLVAGRAARSLAARHHKNRVALQTLPPPVISGSKGAARIGPDGP
jgi:hypothetical protein